MSIRAAEAAAEKKAAPAPAPAPAAKTATTVAKPVDPPKPSLTDAARDNAKAAAHASKPSPAPAPAPAPAKTKAGAPSAALTVLKSVGSTPAPPATPAKKDGPAQTPPKGEAPKPETKAADRVEKIENSSKTNKSQASETAKEQKQASEALDGTTKDVEEGKKELEGKKGDIFWNALNPFNGVLELFKVDNGLTTAKKAAQQAAEQVKEASKKAEELKDEVQSKNQEALRLDRNQDRIDTSLNTAVDHNALVNTVAAVGDTEVAKRLDDINPLDAKTIKVAETGIKGATASYDFVDDTIIITAGMADKTRAAREAAQGAGTLDASGNPLKPAALVDSKEGKTLLGNAAVTGHEAAHAIQDSKGEIDATNAKVTTILDDAKASAQGLPADVAEKVISSAEVKAAKLVLEETEYGPNLEQEQLEAKGGKNSFPVMLDAAGAPLPKVQALANLWAVYTNKPLLHGPSAGSTMPGSGAAMSDSEFASSMLSAGEVEGRTRPGRTRPGRTRP